MKVSYTINDDEKEIVLKPSENGWTVRFEGFETVTPLFDYIIIEKDEEKKQTDGGLMIPETSKEKPSTGTVVAIGGGNVCETTGAVSPMLVSVGDRVIFPKLTGTTVKVNGVEKTLIRQSNILGIIH